MAAIIRRIQEARPDVILNTINGDSNAAFFSALRAGGVSPAAIPAVSFSVGEIELASLGAAQMVGDYAAWNYFQSVESAENERFLRAVRRRLGPADLSHRAGIRHILGRRQGEVGGFATLLGTVDRDDLRRTVVTSW